MTAMTIERPKDHRCPLCGETFSDLAAHRSRHQRSPTLAWLACLNGGEVDRIMTLVDEYAAEVVNIPAEVDGARVDRDRATRLLLLCLVAEFAGVKL